jgi:hypothetical protein
MLSQPNPMLSCACSVYVNNFFYNKIIIIKIDFLTNINVVAFFHLFVWFKVARFTKKFVFLYDLVSVKINFYKRIFYVFFLVFFF